MCLSCGLALQMQMNRLFENVNANVNVLNNFNGLSYSCYKTCD